MPRTVPRDIGLEERLALALADKYEDPAPLSLAGGMATVYKARHRNLDGWDVIKVLRPELARNPDTVDRFLREGRILKRLSRSCDHIPSVYDLHEARSQDLYYMTMQFIDGMSLDERIRNGPIDWKELGPVCRAVLFALAEVHREEIVHRDVKPGNILIDGRGKTWLVDFGIARELRKPGRTGPDWTIGTTEYMSPEHLIGGVLDARSDLYSFGCVLYEALTGERLFQHDDAASMERRLGAEDPLEGREIPGCPAGVLETLRALVSRDPARRPASAVETMERLGIGVPETKKPRFRAVHAVWAAGVSVGVVATLFLVDPWKQPDEPVSRAPVERGIEGDRTVGLPESEREEIVPFPGPDVVEESGVPGWLSPGVFKVDEGRGAIETWREEETQGSGHRDDEAFQPQRTVETPVSLVGDAGRRQVPDLHQAGVMWIKVRITGGSHRGPLVRIDGMSPERVSGAAVLPVQVQDGTSILVEVLDASGQEYERERIEVPASIGDTTEVEFIARPSRR